MEVISYNEDKKVFNCYHECGGLDVGQGRGQVSYTLKALESDLKENKIHILTPDKHAKLLMEYNFSDSNENYHR